jgi:hypothetical protein
VAGPLELIGNEAIPELGVVSMDIDDGVQQVRIVVVTLGERLRQHGPYPRVREMMSHVVARRTTR